MAARGAWRRKPRPRSRFDAGGYYHTSSTIPAGSSCSATGDSVAGQMENYA